VTAPPGVQPDQVDGDGGDDVFEVDFLDTAVAGAAQAGDGDGLVDGGLDTAPQGALVALVLQ
jgi:hypothetical protein